MSTPGSWHSGNSAVVPGHRDKYALVERERRFLMAGPPPGLPAAARRVDIADRYLTGTRLTPRAELLGWLAEFGLDPGGDDAG